MILLNNKRNKFNKFTSILIYWSFWLNSMVVMLGQYYKDLEIKVWYSNQANEAITQ